MMAAAERAGTRVVGRGDEKGRRKNPALHDFRRRAAENVTEAFRGSTIATSGSLHGIASQREIVTNRENRANPIHATRCSTTNDFAIGDRRP